MVYLLHFDRPFVHARHFVGLTDSRADIERALRQPGVYLQAPLLVAARRAGVSFELAELWNGSHETQKALTRRGGARKFCPICRSSSASYLAP